jgi:hypothetical protein
MANIPRLRAVLRHYAMRYIGHISQTPEAPYCYYNVVTNVSRAVQIRFVIPVVFGIPRFSANQHSGLEPHSISFLIATVIKLVAWILDGD